MAIPAGMRRMSLDLAHTVRDRLETASERDGIAAPARVRALVSIWQSDPQLQQRAAAVARQQQDEAKARRVRSRLATLARQQELTQAS